MSTTSSRGTHAGRSSSALPVLHQMSAVAHPDTLNGTPDAWRALGMV